MENWLDDSETRESLTRKKNSAHQYAQCSTNEKNSAIKISQKVQAFRIITSNLSADFYQLGRILIA